MVYLNRHVVVNLPNWIQLPNQPENGQLACLSVFFFVLYFFFFWGGGSGGEGRAC